MDGKTIFYFPSKKTLISSKNLTREISRINILSRRIFIYKKIQKKT